MFDVVKIDGRWLHILRDDNALNGMRFYEEQDDRNSPTGKRVREVIPPSYQALVDALLSEQAVA